MADSKEGKITDINAIRRCAECGGRHKLYQPCTVKSSTVKLRQENTQLRQKLEQFELLAELQDEIHATLSWMIIALDFANRNTGMNAEDSPEMKAAKELRDKLKPESQ